jgi:carboxymethylenebutenolidase
MSVSTVELSTAKGACNVEIIVPEGAGPFPVLVYCCDAGGVRPTATEMAERMSKWGYLVALPDLFYVSGSPWDLLPPGPRSLSRLGELWGNEEIRAKFMKDYLGVASSPASLESCFTALFAHLDTRADVKKGKVGATGYCMGGTVAVRLAEMFPERIGASASFHPGGLATDAPDSPHKQVGKIKGEVYVAAADNDPSFTDEAKAKLVAALEEAKVTHVVETYAGAQHGFAVPDHAASFNEAAAERHYTALEKLLRRAIG